MVSSSKTACRGPMIHIQLDEKNRRQLRIIVAQEDTTIQQLVAGLIQERIRRSSIPKSNTNR